MLVGQPAGVVRHRRVQLAAEGPAVAEGGGGRPARDAPRGIGLDVGRLDPGGGEGQGPLGPRGRRPGGAGARWCCGPGPFRPPAGPPPGCRPPRTRRRRPTRRPARRRERRRRRTRRRPGPRPDPPAGARRPRARRGWRRRRGRVPRSGPPGRRPGRNGPPHGSSAIRCTGTGGPGAPGRSGRRRPGRPGRPGASRCPGCRIRTGCRHSATRASAQPARTASGRPSRVVTSRPSSRRTGVTQATRGAPSTHTVQQPHWPWGLQPSFSERSESCSRRTSSRVAPSSATSTSAPLTRSRISGSADQLKEEPQPQVRVAFGFVTWNPAPCSPSL